MIVAKFGGSSLADGTQFKKVKNIVLSDSERRYIIPSAPGKRGPGDDKVTDLLYACHEAALSGKVFKHLLGRIRERYEEIAEEIGVVFDFTADFEDIANELTKGTTRDYIASRGEFLNGKLLAAYLEFPFVDAARVIRFDKNGHFMEEESNALISSVLSDYPRAVIPGFYGAEDNGEIRTFTRGGSDITGSIIARGTKADIYENWTDVSGIMMADPRIIKDAMHISEITYRELRELSYMGFSVLHDDAVFPVRRAGIPINLRNTNDPKHPGTMIVASAKSDASHPVTGIAGRKGFCAVALEKDMMNAELGFGRRVLQVFEDFGVSFELLPTGIDTMTVIVESAKLMPHLYEVLERLQNDVHPDHLAVHDKLAIIATVGRGMVRNFGTAARLFTAISQQGISIRTIDQGSSELNILVGVDESDFENTLRAIYDAFIRM